MCGGIIKPATKPAEARVKEEKGAWSLGPTPAATTDGWSTHSWPFTPRAAPAISFGVPEADKKLNLCYMFGMVNEEEPVEKALMASSSADITSQDSVNSNLVTIMVDSRASGHYFDDAIIYGLKHRLQHKVHLAKPHKILTAGGVLLYRATKGILQGFVTDNYGNQTLVRVDIVVVPRIGRNLFSGMTAAKTGIVTIFDYENPSLEGLNFAEPLRSKSGDLYSFVLDLSADRYGAKDLPTNAVTNAQMWHRRLGHLHTQPFQLCYGDLIGSFTPVTIGR